MLAGTHVALTKGIPLILKTPPSLAFSGKIAALGQAYREKSTTNARVVFDATITLDQIDSEIVIVDFHGEATSEKIAFGYYVDGERVKPFIVPTFENIHLWMTEGGGE